MQDVLAEIQILFNLGETSMIGNLAVAYLMILSIVVGVLSIFFRGSCAYCHALVILKKLGFKRKTPEFWEYMESFGDSLKFSDNVNVKVDVEMFTYKNAIEFISSKNKWLGELLSCPYCMSWHLSFWSTLIVGVFAYYIYNITFPAWFFALCLFMTPPLSNYLLNKLD